MAIVTTIVNNVIKWRLRAIFLYFGKQGGYPQAFQGKKAAPIG
jgi:hypothetical protein